MAERRQPTADERAIGARLKALRERQRLEPWEVSYRLRMSQQNYQAYEVGRHIISSARLDDFAEALGVSVYELIDNLRGIESRGDRASSFRPEAPALVDRRLVGVGA